MNERSDRQKPMSSAMFKLISLTAAVFYKFMNLSRRLKRSGVRAGQTVLDFGCGSGHFTIAAARMVGDNGKVYALDVHPLAIEAVNRKAAEEGLSNVKTVMSDRDTGLPDESVDVVLLYRTFHLVDDKQGLLDELHRVLKPDCILSVVGGGVAGCLMVIGKDDRFSLAERGIRFLNFRKTKPPNKGVA